MKRKKLLVLLVCFSLTFSFLTACSNKQDPITEETTDTDLNNNGTDDAMEGNTGAPDGTSTNTNTPDSTTGTEDNSVGNDIDTNNAITNPSDELTETDSTVNGQ